MDVDMEDAIQYNKQQRRRKYDRSNEHAVIRTKARRFEDELFHLLQTNPHGTRPVNSAPWQEQEPQRGPEHEINQQESALSLPKNDDRQQAISTDPDLNPFDFVSMIANSKQQPSDDASDVFRLQSDIDAFTEPSFSGEDDPDPSDEEPCLHDHTSVPRKSYCLDLLNLLRDANVCKSHSTRFIRLIQSALPIPNRFPSTVQDILALLKVEDLFVKRSVCLVCRMDLHYDEKKCPRCQVSNEKTIATIYDVNVAKMLRGIVKRLSSVIEDYKKKIADGTDEHGKRDIPFARLYRDLLVKHGTENIISLILHLDGISLTSSTRLKMWLFSGALVELPPKHRYQRYNMVLLSVWVAYAEPEPHLWLRSSISELRHLKEQGTDSHFTLGEKHAKTTRLSSGIIFVQK
jgi:phage FluMu protein Com